MLDKLDWVRPRYEELGMLLSDPAVVQDQEKWRALMREHSQLEPLHQAVTRYEAMLGEQEDARQWDWSLQAFLSALLGLPLTTQEGSHA